MKRVLSVVLVCILCLSMTACSDETMETLRDLYRYTFGGESPWDMEEDDSRQDTDDLYKVPIILLHGRNSNTEIFYGVETQIGAGDNDHYGADKSINGHLYSSPESHRITDVEPGGLGMYLKTLGYQENKNLFAFNYPNQDMVEINADKLRDYINNLIEWASLDFRPDVVDSDALFATQQDKENRRAEFILIGHSMGGLVARYYVENKTDNHTQKLITICTPHYGSSLAGGADWSSYQFVPCDVDLESNSWLFGGEQQAIQNIAHITKAHKYAYINQSSPIDGNYDTDVEYYAIGGYDTDSGDNLAEGLKKHLNDGGAFRVDFDRNAQSKEAFRESINSALNDISMELYAEESTLDLSNIDGDNVVDYMSQFAVDFGDEVRSQKLKKTVLILSRKHNKLDKDNRYHNLIADEVLMHEAVAECITDGVIAGGKCNDNIRWTLDAEGTLTLSGYGKTPDYGKKSGVNQNDQPWYPYRSNIRKIVISQGIQELGWYNFPCCENLTEIEIADSLTHLGYGTFPLCDRLEKVVLPDTVKYIGWDVFYECDNLKNVTLSKGLLEIGYHVFYGCESLETITIPASVGAVGMNCFKGCSNLKKVYFLGDEPDFISGEFHETHPEITLYYISGAQGWTESSWTAPDGTVYRTDTFTP